jgi:hypothetical protein
VQRPHRQVHKQSRSRTLKGWGLICCTRRFLAHRALRIAGWLRMTNSAPCTGDAPAPATTGIWQFRVSGARPPILCSQRTAKSAPCTGDAPAPATTGIWQFPVSGARPPILCSQRAAKSAPCVGGAPPPATTGIWRFPVSGARPPILCSQRTAKSPLCVGDGLRLRPRTTRTREKTRPAGGTR